MEIVEPLLKILLVNIILSGDNAVVIAMASRKLPEHMKRKAVIWGTFGAVAFRILFVFLVLFLLKLPWIHFIGGVLLLFVAYKLLVDKPDNHQIKVGSSLQEAIAIIIFADILMSLDNVLAIVAISDGQFMLIIIGIIISIPIILVASNFIMRLMEKYTSIVYGGAALLAWTAGGMMVKEEHVSQYLEVIHVSESIFLVALILLLLLTGAIRRKI
ncbi:YjbE family putative metal transport protein [Oceanobacillus kapialis]|uniref:YjbE family putative metal transport protein n=1 Tax=Oceanobacillus kapialis TaxID=481353 RepID=A0ABW5PYT7_9BACI